MNSRIRILEPALADQIAAGEVVERPASVIKELLENAVDAGANTITVEVEGGGVVLLRVTDDGVGMSAQDARLCVQRHATSKLASKEDLTRIRTLGFRGEALPSIASVSRFLLKTRHRDDEAGTQVQVEGGGAAEARDVGCAVGTCVQVRDLFYNVPARRKFLKSTGTESAHITDACTRTALVRPQLRLVLIRDGRRALEYLPARNLAERAANVVTDQRLRSIEAEGEGVRLLAALGPPENARAGMSGLHLFVNDRPIRSPQLARAVAFAYGSVLPPGRYPVGAVSLCLEPEEVDVNVHPQKSEVRFAKGQRLLETVTRLLARELGTRAWSGPRAGAEQYWSQRFAGLPLNETTPAVADGGSGAPAPMDGALGAPGRAVGQPFGAADAGCADAGADPWGLGGSQPFEAAPQVASGAARSLVPQAGFFGSLRVLGQVRRMWIVAEGSDALYVLDQHAAHERVSFDQLKRSYEQQEVKQQQLLFPERVECLATQIDIATAQRAALERMGLDCSPIGETTLAVRAVPAILKRKAPAQLVRDVLDQIARTGERAFADAIDMALATMACHGSIRGGDALSVEECQSLLHSLDAVEHFAGHCPHGRPVVFQIGLDELEHRLGR